MHFGVELPPVAQDVVVEAVDRSDPRAEIDRAQALARLPVGDRRLALGDEGRRGERVVPDRLALIAVAAAAIGLPIRPERPGQLLRQELVQIDAVEQRGAGSDPAALRQRDVDAARCAVGSERQRDVEVDLLGKAAPRVPGRRQPGGREW